MNAKSNVDQLHSVVLYTGERKWKSEVKNLPRNWRRSFDDVPMLVVQMRDNDYTVTNEKLQALFDIVQWIYKGKINKIYEKYDGVKIDKKTAILISKITKNERLEEIIEIEKGDIDMCSALKKLTSDSKQEGRIEGKLEEILKQKIKTIKTMLTNGLGIDVILKSGFTQDDIDKAMILN